MNFYTEDIKSYLEISYFHSSLSLEILRTSY